MSRLFIAFLELFNLIIAICDILIAKSAIESVINMNKQDLLAKKIINFRESRDMSQAELANKAHIERTALNKIEKGTRKVSSDELRSIALALDVSSDTLLNLNDSKRSQFTDDDLDAMLDDARSYDGKPINDHDREVIRAYLEGHFDK